ncbi:uncharacterized protein LOC113357190 [Papaver somniferum]|uniref:uncharacterized protein LOC113357190 n=1 Tax=Papaver somniferum TaxID=3469 RepID=UPI000E6FC384|nr:uncharacterized protein LOC113357190 [Papaver somniferum]
MVEIWFMRNAVFYEEEKPDYVKIQNKIRKMAHDCEYIMQGKMWGSTAETDIMHYFLIQHRMLRRVRNTMIYFSHPGVDEVLLCCDGASRGNPGTAGYGFAVRNHNGEFVYAEAGGLGMTTNFIAEFVSSIRAFKWAFENQLFKVILQSDSKSCIHSLEQQKIPWFLLTRWQRIYKRFHSINYRHVYREINFAADHFAKKGAQLGKGHKLCFEERPNNLVRMEVPGHPCYKFD